MSSIDSAGRWRRSWVRLLGGRMFNHMLKMWVGGFTLALLVARTADATVTATFVDPSFTTASAAGGGAEFDSASVILFVNPAVTKWIAWNDAATVSYTHPSRPGELFLGPGGIGVDDF